MYNSTVFTAKPLSGGKRNDTIDLLRVLGLILVISAHCGFSSWFTNARDFDVILLMFVSGMSFALSHASKSSFGSYVKKRFLRLILPVWIFLTFFFVFFRLLGRVFFLREIIESYLLLAGGVLFVWVYRVFFTSALLNPFLEKLKDRAPVPVLCIASAAMLAVNDLLSVFCFSNLGTAGKGLQYIFTYTIAYGIVSFLGILFETAEVKERLLAAGIFAAFFAGSGALMKFPVFYECKYPPMLYYCAYGLSVSMILYLLLERITLSGKSGSLIVWMSVHTMDIFMWHIFAYYFLEWLSPAAMEKPWLDFAVFFGGGVLGAFIQEKITMLLKRRKAGWNLS